MPINRKVYDLCAEVMKDYKLSGERHHLLGRGAGAQLGAINDILICGIVPAPFGHSESVHLHGAPREELERYIDGKSVHELQQLIRACHAQVELILTRGAWKSL